ncbi:MAG: TonB-dependent receptor [Henriciella sp.]|nr:TonB-dependent receptor [Henriciella sp.]
MYYKSALFCALSLSLAAPVTAQETDSEDLKQDTVIVEGSRLNQTKTEIGSSVSIITADDIDRLGLDFALDAVASAPGVTINSNGAFGGQAGVRIRGASSEQTLVLVDGIVVNDPTSPGGGFNFARFDTESIDRIEVLKGPQSTLWGTDAIGGVVSITTKRPDEGLGGSAFAEYGSFNTIRGGASLENANETGDFRLAIVGTSSDGISKADENNGNDEDDAYEALTLSAKGGFNLAGDARLSADVLWTDAESEFDSFSGGAQGSVADGDQVSLTEELSANLSLTGSLFDGRLENLLLVGYSDISRENLTDGVSSFEAEGDRMVYRYQGTFSIDAQNTLAFGAEREDTTSRGDETSIDGLFALYEFKPTEQITLTGGLRMDDHERFGSETTARLAAAYNPTESLTLRASWGQGFKAPTIFQTTFFCCGATAPNTDLQPETSEAFDIGLDWRSEDGRTEAGITLFDQDTENQIDFSFALGGYENIAVVESQGVELYAAHQLTDWLSVSADYAYIDAKDGDGDALVRLPEHSGDVTVSIDPDGPFSGALLVRYNGEEPNTDGTILESWTRVDLTGSYDLNEKVELFGRIENLFDEEYQQILGYGTPDLSGSIGIRLRY